MMRARHNACLVLLAVVLTPIFQLTASCGVYTTERSRVVYGSLADPGSTHSDSADLWLRRWRPGMMGAVYTSNKCGHAFPEGIACVNHTVLLQQHLGSSNLPADDADTTLGIVGAVAMYDLYKRHPEAQWYAYVQHDTYIVPANIEVELLKYNASEPWFIGGTHTLADNDSKVGHYAKAEGGIFVSQGAMQRAGATWLSCAAHLARRNAAADAGLSLCLLAHGVPLTHHPGMHITGDWHPTMLDHHPPAPFLTIQGHDKLSSLMDQVVEFNPAGFAQRARFTWRLNHTMSLVLNIASGVSVQAWVNGASHTSVDRLSFPANWTSSVTNPPHVPQPTPVGVFQLAAVAQTASGPTPQCGITTTYNAVQEDQGLMPFHRVVVHEPAWTDRWRHSPTSLCVTQWHLTKSSHHGKHSVLILHLDKGPTGCIREGFEGRKHPARTHLRNRKLMASDSRYGEAGHMGEVSL